MGGSYSFPAVPLSAERVVVITGANTGIGYETAKHIAIMGASVIIACRSEERALKAIDQMNSDFRHAQTTGTLPEGVNQEGSLNVEFMKVDLASLKSVMEFIETFKASGRKLHVLLCNAGVAMLPLSYTEDDHETMFQVNYLSHFLLVAHLLPIMKTSGEDCRIIFTSSDAHMYCETTFSEKKIKVTDTKTYGRMLNYGSSKLFQILHMFCLTRRLGGTSNISVAAIHPGIVRTEVTRSFRDSRPLMAMFYVFQALGLTKTAIDGATTLINTAVNPDLEGKSDVYYIDCKPGRINTCARSKEYQEQLWAYSLECLKTYMTDDIPEKLELTVDR